ncbi:DUF3892 domain-containing protein [Mucilaginibacter sp. 14171R-50]|uniref:DUF3892 domain-containing protein n=1 Tax=Mucilaginibacter sp. 14171R-50 TaxID=2703789 RepID=UPI00138BEDFE|nr:DUF3892 domain-containing protein [Mucilaginibacter sp. 14171R-50]QHS56529.1 DUF3892 domain-containing protein [Mucilaginibacter sp. 14171R-50]
MANFKISGVWKNANDVITHYAIHSVGENSTSRAVKTTKADAVKLLTNTSNTAMTWLWDYQNARWKDGEKVTVVNNSYLRSNHDNKLTDNLGHLIDYDWLLS